MSGKAVSVRLSYTFSAVCVLDCTADNRVWLPINSSWEPSHWELQRETSHAWSTEGKGIKKEDKKTRKTTKAYGSQEIPLPTLRKQGRSSSNKLL